MKNMSPLRKALFLIQSPSLIALRESHNPNWSLSGIHSCDSQRGIETKISGKRLWVLIFIHLLHTWGWHVHKMHDSDQVYPQAA